jgi:hypothetical protein
MFPSLSPIANAVLIFLPSNVRNKIGENLTTLTEENGPIKFLVTLNY